MTEIPEGESPDSYTLPQKKEIFGGVGEDTFLNGKYMYIDTCRLKVPQDFGNIFF